MTLLVMGYKIEILDNHRVSKIQQIVNRMSSDIDLGILPKNAKVPSINEFSKSHDIARETVEKAYRRLKDKGYLAAVHGIGYFVDKDQHHQYAVPVI